MEVIDQTSLRYFKPHEQAEILALKAKLQFKAKIQNVDPNKTFSHAVQLFDSNVAWGLWAEHLVQVIYIIYPVLSNPPVSVKIISFFDY